MQYFSPGNGLFVGDCMPFYHDGVFRFYYLQDENHHQALGGLGGHQWAQASTTDLVSWEHHPLAIAITEDWEGSICTGSTFHHEGTYYGFYATRRADRTQHLSLAVSDDAVHFTKIDPNPYLSPPGGYSPFHYRDPHVFADDSGLFHLLVTAELADQPLSLGGCLAHLVSDDLVNWELQEPFIIPGTAHTPECPDYFEWNGWYYLAFGLRGHTHYRMSRAPFGPWLRPAVCTLDSIRSRVMKTAAFGANRRLAAAFVGCREGDRDDGRIQYAGNAVFRELVQNADGTLGTGYPEEMIPASGEPIELHPFPLTDGARAENGGLLIPAAEGLEAGVIEDVPPNARITITVQPDAGTAGYGLRLRYGDAAQSGYELWCRPHERTVSLHDTSLTCVDGLDQPTELDIVMKDDLIDCSVSGRRCLINRCPEQRGDRLLLFCQNGRVLFERVIVRQLA